MLPGGCMYDIDGNDNDIVIERVKAENSDKPKKKSAPKSKPKSKKKTTTRKKGKAKSAPLSKKESTFAIHARIAGVLLSFIVFFVLLALISYSRSDQMNINFPISEIFGMFSEDSVIKAKAEVTENWLGLVGAKIADFIYNSLFGFIGLFGVLIMFLPARDLITDCWIREKTFHRLLSFTIFAVVFSIAIGS